MNRSVLLAILLLMLTLSPVHANLPFVQLPPFVVTDDRVLPKPEAWRYAQAEGIEVLSNLPDKVTEPYLLDLLRYRRAVERLWPVVDQQDEPRVEVIFCNSPDWLSEFEPRASASGGFGSIADEGGDEAMLLFPVGPADSDENQRRAVNYRLDSQQHLYCDAVVAKIGEHVPAWLDLGLSRLLHGMVYKGNFAGFPALTTDPTLKIRQSAAAGSLQQALRQGSFYTLPAMFAKRSSRPGSWWADGGGGRRGAQLNNDFSGPWADECYEFVHLCLLGCGGQYRAPFLRFATLTSQGPMDEAAFQQIFGRDYASMLDLLWHYTDVTNAMAFKISPTGAPGILSVGFRAAADGEVGRIRGEFLLAHHRLQPAHWSLIAPYVRGSRDPDLLASLGLQEVAGKQPDRARKFLEAAVAANTRRARAYAELGRLRLTQALGPNGEGVLSSQQVADILTPIASGLRLPPALPEFPRVLMQTWYHSQTAPTLDEFQLINRAVYRFPFEAGLYYADAALHQHFGFHSAALVLAGIGVRNANNPLAEAQLSGLRDHLHQDPDDRGLSLSAPPGQSRDQPVAVPRGLPPEFTAEGMRTAIQTAAMAARVSIRKLTIDSSEFPFLVGMVCTEKGLERLLVKLPDDYEYQKSSNNNGFMVMGFIPDKYISADVWEAVRARHPRRVRALMRQMGAPN